MIEVKGVNKSFGEKHVLHDINAEFHPGKVNLIIGQSGQGKSVLTKCIVGLMEVDTGSIHFDGRDFSAMNRRERREIRKEIGMLFQGSALFDSMTVEQNIMFPLDMYTSMTKEEKIDRANFCLKRVNLENTNHLFPAECSGGMQKRIAIARAISMNPKYLFCDEPNSGLDPRTSILIDNLIKEITYEYNMTTVVITHDMNSVMEIGDKIIFINEGKVWWEGDNKEILTTNNPEIIDFVYASKFMKNLKGKLS
ncbi:phospholipid/cholesterol/gamma-HCH transport system ATP-binding protein [Lishizhenia tianjinensis]|uniref:Phospholipid/cholesterol/gamma-HCH transport system ATP-binding protein n=1 Tax=Lishizhenia tianjinensis TaxID=477690 RepID=A0A1I6ZYV5_9FLAO|nr:ATP-binding cassette domain-containing protein [Lishizhenia tianjinensis]SFT67827.1 phospholipid/cholesterol/gamma-HCH transport system ATP-binding protein [Lishizhenia tianjinensis]